MAVLSLDIGTTKICALVMDEGDLSVVETREADNAFLSPPNSWNRCQDPETIFAVTKALVSELAARYGSFRCMGITCQMHGILYINSSGRAVSPLYTWQDQSASLPYMNGKSYAACLAEFSPSPVAPGYGLASCFYHVKTNTLPPGAVKLCAIGDYIAMRFCNSSMPLMHSTVAGSIGFFDLPNFRFAESSLERAGLDPSLLPPLTAAAAVYGETAEGIPVCPAIGDNQASFLGAVREPKESVSINIGTGSQISLLCSDPARAGAMEAWSYFDGLFLLVGASLCGGRAYAILETFFRDTLKMAGLPAGASLYPAMNVLAMEAADSAGPDPAASLAVKTLFAGSRRDPSLRGSITNISEDNFTPAAFVAGFLRGIVNELYDYYLPLADKGNLKTLVGSGNAVRRNEALKKILSGKFNLPLVLSPYREEAAYGAALFALAGTGFFGSVLEAQRSPGKAI